MTAAVPADGDGVRVCRIHKRRQSFISARERNLLRPSGLWFFGSSLENLGIGRRPGGQTAQFVFPPVGALMFSLCSPIPRAGRGERAAPKAPDLIVAREDSQIARASCVPASFATRACRGVRTPPSPWRRCPASDVDHSARSSDGLVAATVPARSSAWAIRNATTSRHGAAMICTPMGSGWNGTGATTTGRPMNEIGWV
jgi:hypothetical protein